MKGLIVKCKDNFCKAGNFNDGVGLIVNVTRYDGVYWNLGGFRKSDKRHLIWNGGKLQVGDVIEVEFAEFDEATPPVVEAPPESLFEEASADTEMWNRKLDVYHRLKKILEDEGILKKD